MARRSGGSHKCVEEKRRMLPIYQHYTLSPGRTKSHHPEAKCNHCHKEFVCGSKQRLIRHLRKCNSITNPEQIIAETLNTLARNSANGQLNHSILEASNLLPSQISHIHASTNQQLVGQAIQQQHYHPHAHHLQHHPNNHSTLNSTTSANRNLTNTNNCAINNSPDINVNGTINTSGSSSANNDSMIVATPNNGSTVAAAFNGIIPVKKTRRGRRPGNPHGVGSGIHVTTGLDGKTQFTPISQLPPGVISSSPQLITPVHNGGTRGGATYAAFHQATSGCAPSNVAVNSAAAAVVPSGVALSSGHLHVAPFKLNSEPIDKAYLKLVLTKNLPLSLCDTKEFQNWVRTLANDYKPPSSINLIAQNLKQEAQSARQRVSNILVKTPKKTVNLELHCWPDQLRGHLWYAIIAALDSWRFLISIKDVLGQLDSGFAFNNNHFNSTNNDGISMCQSTDELSLQHADPKILSEFIDDCIKRVGSDRVNSLMFTGKMITELAIVTRARRALYTNHPSIVTYYCWWHFTNLLSSDVIENDENFLTVMRNSNNLINFINKRPQLYLKIERFSPFAGATGALNLKKDDSRWYSHLVCYSLEFIKNNHEAILKALEDYYPSAETTQLLSVISDNNNNSASDVTGSQINNVQHNNNDSNLTSTQLLQKQNPLQREQTQLAEIRSIVMSSEFWTNLNATLVYLKPFRDIVALVSNAEVTDHTSKMTPVISTTLSNHLSLSDYMHWFLNYGKSLFDSWHQSPDRYKYNLIGHYVRRFDLSINNFKLLFAAYLLNPRYRCAYVTQKAKDSAIEEILNIASEFMPEESDGHTIFDQWKLYLVREEPYDMAYDEGRSNSLDWWMSLPCAESIRRVALRILRMKAFSSPKPELIFSQLHLYEDETKTSLGKGSFEDLAILRYFYDHEDRLSIQNSTHSILPNNSFTSISVPDRTQVGQAHNGMLHEANDPAKYLPSGGLNSSESSDEQFTNDSLTINEGGEMRIFTDVGNTYMDGVRVVDHLDVANSNLSLENLPGFDQFANYIDFNQSGIQVIEEPIEKKRRKWTAQEILSKCQSNHNNNSSATNSNNDAANNKLGDK